MQKGNRMKRHRARQAVSARRSIIAFLVLALLMVACGGTEGGTAGSTEAAEGGTTEGGAAEGGDAAAIPTSPEEVEGTIRFSWWGGAERNEKTNAVIDLFEEQYPNVTVEREVGDFDPHWEKLTVQAAANDQPCVIQMQSRYMNSYAARGVLRPLDDLVESGVIDTSGVPEPFMASGRYEDQLYSVPTGIFYYVFMYNEDLLTEAGVEEPTGDWTWEDFKQLLLDAQEGLPEGIYASNNSAIDPRTFYSFVGSHGQEVFAGNELGFDEQLMADWFQMWEDLRAAGATTTAEMMAEEPEMLEQSYLAQGRVMMTDASGNQIDGMQGPLDTTEVGGTLDMQKVPNGPAGAGDDLGSNGMSIGANCPEENIPAAAAWINFFLNNPEGAEIYASDNGVVTVESLMRAQLEDPETTTGQKRNIELLLEIVEYEPEPVVYPAGFAALESAQKRAYESVVFGDQTIEEAVAEFFDEANRLLAGGA